MYESFYKLSEKPFTLLPDPGFLYMSDKHRMALTLLEYGLMNHAGFTVISGDIGAGKTTLIRHVLDNMDRDHTVGLISNTHRDFGELLQWILLAFNLEHKDMNKVEMYQRFVDFIIDEYAHNRTTVLIVDEAQNMGAETLEELRMLSNINADKDQALQVILVGQRELRETLQRPDLVQFAQRISVDYHLQALAENETAGYIRHRMEVAGGDPDTFTEMSCKAVHRYSGGVPRLINLLCDTALVYGFAEQKHRIDARLVTDVAREKQAGGIFPTFDEAGLEEIVEPEIAPEESAPAQLEETEIESMEAPDEPEPAPDTIEPVDMEQPATPESQESMEVATQTEEPVVDLQPAQPAPARGSAAEPEETQGTLSEAEHRWRHGQPQKKKSVWRFFRRRRV
jgi:type II secretory pathway predicted ATPase ExeA